MSLHSNFILASSSMFLDGRLELEKTESHTRGVMDLELGAGSAWSQAGMWTVQEGKSGGECAC